MSLFSTLLVFKKKRTTLERNDEENHVTHEKLNRWELLFNYFEQEDESALAQKNDVD